MATTLFRNARKKNFTQISNSLLNDDKVTLEAKALLTIFLSNKEDWKIQMKEIIKRSKNGRDAHYRALDELIEHGYVARVEIRNKSGVIEKREYIFSDDKDEVKQELKEIKHWAEENEKQLIVTYCVKKEKKKRTRKKDNDPIPENQDMGVQPFPENPNQVKQDSENPNTENSNLGNQYIKNKELNNTNLDNTNLDNTIFNNSSSSFDRKNNIEETEEEEKELIISLCKENIAYQVLFDHLHRKGLEKDTIANIILNCHKNGLDIFHISDVEAQYESMMEKILLGETIYDFAVYFVNGLKKRTEQANISRKYQMKKLEEYKIAIDKNMRREPIFYNWLEE